MPSKPHKKANTIYYISRPIVIGRVNWIGFFTLYWREVMRFLKILGQTIIAPMVTVWLFLAIFTVAIGERGSFTLGGEVGLQLFLAPGLVIMASLQNAFANSSTSLVVGKVQGNIVDLIMPPLSPSEVCVATLLAGVTRGVVVATATIISLVVFGVLPAIAHWGVMVYFLVIASAIMTALGLIAGIWADKFDDLASISNFIVQPLVFLSGTFYSIDRLPAPFDTLALYNPVFYMIDGFRAGVIGVASVSVWFGGAVLMACLLVLAGCAHHLLTIGYKLKN